MRTFTLIVVSILVFCLFFAGCIVQIVSTAPAAAAAASAPAATSTLQLISLAILGIYEVVVRVVPSVADYSVVSWVIGILKKISDTLNIRT